MAVLRQWRSLPILRSPTLHRREELERVGEHDSESEGGAHAEGDRAVQVERNEGGGGFTVREVCRGAREQQRERACRREGSSFIKGFFGVASMG